MPPARIPSKILRREEVADRTVAFHFEKPEGWTFTPGQFFHVALSNSPKPDPAGDRRAFSIASAPHEATVIAATRMRGSPFKETLASLPIGSAVELEAPMGDFTLPKDPNRAAVLLAGGIGITPFRSMIVDAAHRHSSRPIHLFYSNRSPKDAPFLTELQALEREHPNFRLTATMTGLAEGKGGWSGEDRKIDAGMVRHHHRDPLTAVFYAAGPPTMVQAMRTMLGEVGVDEMQIRTEEFDGY